MLNVCAYTGNMNKVDFIYKDMEKESIKPDSRLFTALIVGYTKEVCLIFLNIIINSLLFRKIKKKLKNVEIL